MNKILAWLYPQWFQHYHVHYCPICESCGEDGCCQAILCKQHPHGFYCQTYLKDLQFAYRLNKKLELLLEKQGFNFDSPEYKTIFDEAYKQVYER